ncbi:hypothetical protein H6P81_014796 [Aristolochia fimbriata]|uniref:Coiled-coil domain-containing protein 86 n=1 Tax=Aristolochia fimbriata TaxID=158543 RepID=A0AAV7E6I7_ARIFI|nr:hypothetical protein H6P81_014796 [Aristolochia fimbriata]
MASTIDFRRLDDGFGVPRNKRKRSAADEDAAPAAMDVDAGDAPPSAKRPALPSADDPSRPSFGNPTYDGVIAGKVSGRKWKQPREQRASAIRVSCKGTTFEHRARQKEIKKAYTQRMQELKDEIRNNKIEKRKRREEREKKKQENILRSGTKLQKITNPKTLKKIAKSKQKKLLKVVPDEVLNKNKKAKKLELLS